MASIGEERDRNMPTNLTFAYAMYEVGAWLDATFGPGHPRADDIEERCCRSAEEQIELMQALGLPKEKLLALVEHVYSKQPGVPFQELGGTLITLLALARATKMSPSMAFKVENSRCWDRKDEIRAKALAKEIKGDNV